MLEKLLESIGEPEEAAFQTADYRTYILSTGE
jgi:hypothetical protein